MFICPECGRKDYFAVLKYTKFKCPKCGFCFNSKNSKIITITNTILVIVIVLSAIFIKDWIKEKWNLSPLVYIPFILLFMCIAAAFLSYLIEYVISKVTNKK